MPIRGGLFGNIHYYEAPEEFEMYDLQNDPGELHNLHGDGRHAGLAADLRRRLEELREEK